MSQATPGEIHVGLDMANRHIHELVDHYQSADHESKQILVAARKLREILAGEEVIALLGVLATEGVTQKIGLMGTAGTKADDKFKEVIMDDNDAVNPNSPHDENIIANSAEALVRIEAASTMSTEVRNRMEAVRQSVAAIAGELVDIVTPISGMQLEMGRAATYAETARQISEEKIVAT